MYRHHLETLALALHPFRVADSAPQTPAQVVTRLQAAVEAIEALAARHQFPACPTAKRKVRKPWPAMASLGSLSGLLVGRCRAGFGARRPVDALEKVGEGLPLTASL